jgi:hypothetical protein
MDKFIVLNKMMIYKVIKWPWWRMILYIFYPFEIALILKESDASDEMIVAGILYDVLEDKDVSEDELPANSEIILQNWLWMPLRCLRIVITPRGRNGRPYVDLSEECALGGAASLLCRQVGQQ